MNEEEREKLKKIIDSNCVYHYAQLDGTYRIPNSIEGEFVVLMLQAFYNFPKERIIFYNLKKPSELFDADGHPLKKLDGYVRVDEENVE